MFDKIKRLKVKFINFKEKEKIKNKNAKINSQKVKEASLLVLAAVLIGIGYTNFSSGSNNPKELISSTVSTSSTNSIGDVQLVSSSAAVVENDENSEIVTNTVQEAASNNAIVSNDNSGEVDVQAKNNNALPSEEDEDTIKTSSSSNSNYFAELKMDRDDMYSKSLETYQKIVNSENVSAEQKSIAIQEIDKINNTKNAIQMAEELIKLKGFEDVVIYSSNGQISATIRIAVLSDSQVAQIQNIISKELGVEVSDITISNK